jgi:hypothetical protein
VDQLIRAYRTRGHMIAEIDRLDAQATPAGIEPAFTVCCRTISSGFSYETVHPAGR